MASTVHSQGPQPASSSAISTFNKQAVIVKSLEYADA